MNVAMKDSTPTTPMPQLRFPKFREPWGTTTVGSFFDLSGKANKIENFDRERLLTVKLHGNGVVKNEKTTLTGGANYFTRKAGQFIFSKIDLLNGAFGVVPDALDGFASSSDVPAYSFKDEQCPRFFLYWLRAFYERLTIERTGTSNTLKRVSPDSFLALPLLAPSPAEQQKIADCLTSLDEVIAAQARKVEALKAHKKGLMQHLFPREGETTPRLRFPEFRDGPEWDLKPLGELAEFQSGGTPSKANTAYWNGTVPWASAKDMKQLLLEDTEDHISEAAIADGAKLVQPGTILILTRGMTLLKDVPICLPCQPMSFNQDVRAVRPHDGLDVRYLAFLLVARRESLMRLVDIAGHGTGRLDTDKLKAFAISITTPAEQQRIADCLSSLDAAIAAAAAALAALKTHKKGLMQGLFPQVSL